MFLLDTNVISELRSGKTQQSQTVRAWAARQDVQQLYLSAITVLELDMGILSMQRRDAAQGAVLRAWSEQVLRQFEGRILGFTEHTARWCAPLHVPDKASFRDSMIAATALEHRFSVVTRNVDDFRMPGLQLVNPWDPPP